MTQAPAPSRDYAPWRRPFRPTREGWVFLFVTLGVGIAAVNTGNNLLFLVLGMLLSVLVLSGVMSERVLRGIEVARALPRRAFAGAACVVEIRVHNHKQRLSTYSISVEDIVPGEPARRRCYFLKIAPGTEQVASYQRLPRRRGHLRYEGFRVTTRYPFGLIEKSRLFYRPEEQLIYPALSAPSALPAVPPRADDGASTPRIGPGHDVAGLRRYRTGDEARFIHWRRSARLGRPVVREMAIERSERVTLELDNLRPDGADATWDQAFERAVSTTAGLAYALVRRGSAVRVATRDGASPFAMPGAGVDGLLAYLALVGPATDAGAAP